MSYKRIETENGIFVITKPDAVKRFFKKLLCHYLFNDCFNTMYVQTHILLHIFLYYKNFSKCEIHLCLQIFCNQGWGNIAGDPFPFL